MKFSFGPSYDWFSNLGADLKQRVLVSKSISINNILFLWSVFPYYLLDSYTAKVGCVHTHFNSSHLSYFPVFFLSWFFNYVLHFHFFSHWFGSFHLLHMYSFSDLNGNLNMPILLISSFPVLLFHSFFLPKTSTTEWTEVIRDNRFFPIF